MLVMLDTSHRHRLRIRVNLLRSTTVSLIRALAKDTIPKVHAYPSVLAQLRRHPLPSSLASVLSDTLVLSVRDAMMGTSTGRSASLCRCAIRPVFTDDVML